MKITLISPVHLWVNPRLVKEADALLAAGHEVCVISVSNDAWSAGRDQELYLQKKWRWIKIDLVKTTFAGCAQWFWSALRQKLFFQISKAFNQNMQFAEEAYCRGYSRILRLALKEKADFYIAHTQAVLGIAARVAEKNGVGFGFDCEDLNAEALADGGRDAQVKRNIEKIEGFYLPKARYVQATSLPMAQFLAKKYLIPMPTVVHNTFSGKELSGIKPPAERPTGKNISMVWMSATIGRGRGLEMVLNAMPKLSEKLELHVYGRFLDPLFQAELMQRINSSMKDRVFFSPLVPPQKIMSEVSKYDIGLALEDGSCHNLALTITNKFFLYLQSGLAIAATNVPGQQSFFDRHPEVGFVVSPNDSEALALGILRFLEDPKKLLSAKEASWKVAQQEFNWDVEKNVFLANIKKYERK